MPTPQTQHDTERSSVERSTADKQRNRVEMMKNVDHCFPKNSGDVLKCLCSLAKDIQFTLMDGQRNQKIITLEKMK